MFDLTEIKDESGVLPAGNYPAFVDKAELKKSNAGAEYLNIMWRITGENYGNKCVFDIMNLFHDKENVRNIALNSLKKMLLASGFDESALKIADNAQLLERVLGCRCEIKVGVRNSVDFGEQNQIKGYAPLVEGKHAKSPF